jgi:hypothetical protein
MILNKSNFPGEIKNLSHFSLKGRFDDGGSSILIRPPARLPSFFFMGINKLWLRALALGAGATFDWLFFDNSKLTDFDC